MRCDHQSHLVPNSVLGMGPCHQSTGANKSFSVLRLHNRRSLGGARPGRGSAWPPPDSYFFLLLPVRTFSSWVTLKQFVRVQGKKQNPKIFLRNSLLVRQKKSPSTVRGGSACTVELINSWGFKWMVFYSHLYMSFHLECIFLWNTSAKWASVIIPLFGYVSEGPLQKITSLAVVHANIGLAYAGKTVLFLFYFFLK